MPGGGKTFKAIHGMTSWLMPFINIQAEGQIYVPNGVTNGRLHVSYDEEETVIKEMAQYNILETDYTSYSLVYGCKNGKNWLGKDEYTHDLWLLTRKGDLPQDKVKNLLERATARTGQKYDTSSGMYFTKQDSFWCNYGDIKK